MSIFDPVERVPNVPTWRCPSCRTLQPESTSCRACGRSFVTCRTCHWYRGSLVGALGLCALDAARQPLSGDDVRACWVSGDPAPLPSDGLFRDVQGPSAPPPSSAAPAASSQVLPPLDGGRPKRADPGLVEAPLVPPSADLRSEMRRRLDQDEA